MDAQEELYKAIAAKLNTDLKPEKTAIDLFRGKIEYHSDDIKAYPFFAIDIREIDWIDKSEGVQEGESLINIYVVHMRFANTYHGSINQDKGLESFDTMKAVYLSLQDFEGACFSKLTRVRQVIISNDAQLFVNAISFRTRITDESKKESEDLQQVNPDLEITRKIKTN